MPMSHEAFMQFTGLVKLEKPWVINRYAVRSGTFFVVFGTRTGAVYPIQNSCLKVVHES